MTIHDLLRALQATPLATLIRENGYVFPAIESIHVLAITMVVGSIAMVDLRLIGVAGAGQSARRIIEATLPWTWGAFCFAVITGGLLFSSQAVGYFDNVPFSLEIRIARAGRAEHAGLSPLHLSRAKRSCLGYRANADRR